MGGTITAKGAKGTHAVYTRWRKDGRPFVRDGVTLENELRDFANCNRGPGKQSVYICSDLREFVKEGKRLPLSLHSSPSKPKFSILFAFCFGGLECGNYIYCSICKIIGGPLCASNAVINCARFALIRASVLRRRKLSPFVVFERFSAAAESLAVTETGRDCI